MNDCKKVILAGNDGCRVMYCELHQVAELEIGALSLKLDVEAFSSLNELINEATQKIAVIHQARNIQDNLMRKLKNM